MAADDPVGPEVADDDGPTSTRWMKALRAAPGVTENYLLVLFTVGTYWTFKQRRVWASQATIAAACGLSERTVGTHIRNACRDGWLEKVRRGGRAWSGETTSSVYRLALPSTGSGLLVEEAASTGRGLPVEHEGERSERAS